ncbi:ybl82 [Escherichia coli PA7]|nr:ybl82 [Escherichia coli PA7]
MRCLVPPGDVNQLTINAGYRESPHNTVLVLTVPRALSRIHRITKFTLKRAAEQSRSKTDTAKRHQKIDNRGRCSGVVT